MNWTQPKEATVFTAKKRVMIAGVGNMFMKDDGFGGAVIKKIINKEFPVGVEIKDFGTGGLKLAYDLMRGYDALILVDASKRGEAPGTLYVIEPDEKEVEPDLEQGGPIDPHGGDPATVLRFLKALGAWPAKIVIIGCEPYSLSFGEDGNEAQIGLSEQVAAAVDKAVELVEENVREIYAENR